MGKYIILKFDSPLMSFGAPIVDNFGFIQDFPSLSMLTGLIANSLGINHSEHEKLHKIQNSIIYSVMCESKGIKVQDLQRANLDSNFMQKGWTTWGDSEARKGGVDTKIDLRYRDYLANALYTVALQVNDNDLITLDNVVETLKNPCRPLFIGRKPCLPSRPIFDSVVEAKSLIEALKEELKKISMKGQLKSSYEVWVPSNSNLEELDNYRLIKVTDSRDWVNQIHIGSISVYHGQISLEQNNE